MRDTGKRRRDVRTTQVVIVTEWRDGGRTPAWDELWRLILSNTISESLLKEEEPSRERPTDGV